MILDKTINIKHVMTLLGEIIRSSHQTKNKLLILNKLISPSYHAVRGNSYRNAPAFRDAGASTHTFPRTDAVKVLAFAPLFGKEGLGEILL